jgi:hypothetical protein
MEAFALTMVAAVGLVCLGLLIRGVAGLARLLRLLDRSPRVITTVARR